MSDIDFILCDVQMLLSRNKGREWREMILKYTTSLMRFLSNHQLLVDVTPFDEDGRLKEDLLVRKSNVTAEGLALYKQVIPGWGRYLDRSTVENKYENISRLEKGLAALRNKPQRDDCQS
ncbi:hypothetical protein FJU30_06935 [Affinibrenneria salicis]|uniref:Uncharacterized protein n=1 Tax=Affinibrenneria salicis TaxID=2590031 RepID=A0A5J5G4S3_9GAMM|nr:hypothetical protein [Affinibrenneria salicis]KAA9002008.1 hypothetical protein FJU30_06935 [Affinibrenneria salicis]